MNVNACASGRCRACFCSAAAMEDSLTSIGAPPAVVYKPSGTITRGAGTSARLTRNVECVGLLVQVNEPCRPVDGGKTRCQGWAYDVLMTSGVRLVPTAAVGG